MDEQTRALLLRTAFIAVLATVFALALAPVPEDLKLFSWQDKVEHLLLFAGLGLLGFAAWPRRLPAVATGLLVYGVAMELAQSYSVHRHGDAADWVADALGVGLALLLHTLWRRTEAN